LLESFGNSKAVGAIDVILKELAAEEAKIVLKVIVERWTSSQAK
jgi:hypothetical protein